MLASIVKEAGHGEFRFVTSQIVDELKPLYLSRQITSVDELAIIKRLLGYIQIHCSLQKVRPPLAVQFRELLGNQTRRAKEVNYNLTTRCKITARLQPLSSPSN